MNGKQAQLATLRLRNLLKSTYLHIVATVLDRKTASGVKGWGWLRKTVAVIVTFKHFPSNFHSHSLLLHVFNFGSLATFSCSSSFIIFHAPSKNGAN